MCPPTLSSQTPPKPSPPISSGSRWAWDNTLDCSRAQEPGSVPWISGFRQRPWSPQTPPWLSLSAPARLGCRVSRPEEEGSAPRGRPPGQKWEVDHGPLRPQTLNNLGQGWWNYGWRLIGKTIKEIPKFQINCITIGFFFLKIYYCLCLKKIK